MECTKIEVRSNVKFLTKLGWKPADIINALSSVYEDSVPPDPTVYRWIREFKQGRDSVEDEQRSGRPITSRSENIIIAVQKAVEQDRRVTIDAIAEEVGISHGSVHAILTENLELSNLSARWGLTCCAPNTRPSASNVLRIFSIVWTLIARIFTRESSPATKLGFSNTILNPKFSQRNGPRHPRGTPGPKKFRADRSVAKVLATVFWDTEGVILVDFLEDQKSITAVYYEAVLLKLRRAIARKRRAKLSRHIIFHHDNAPAHTSRLCRDALRQFRWEILQHPPYSPDLAPSDFFLFPKMKEAIKGVRHESKEAAKKAALEWLAGQYSDFFRKGLERWEHRMEKCLMSAGDYARM